LLRQLRQHVEVALTHTGAAARDVRFLHRFVGRTAKLLGQKASSRAVRRSFGALLQEIREALKRYPDSLREQALRHMLSTARHFGRNLFTCYDHPDIPPTDNDLEQVFRVTRRHERLITGHKSTARRTVRDGPFLVPALNRAGGNLPSAEELSGVAPEVWRRNLETLRAGRARYNRPRFLHAHLKSVLRDLVKNCRQLTHSRAP
jgi:hypothetical protein